MEKPPLPLPNNARATERSRANLLVSYTIAADVPAEYTETYDIATGGMAMLTNAALEHDIGIAIELELRGDPRPRLQLSGNVRWSTYDPLLRKYRTGVAFIELDDQIERQLLHYIDTLHDIRALGGP